MTKINTGGPAFPGPFSHAMGMTLRDYAAIHDAGMDVDASDIFAAAFNPDPKPDKDDRLAWAKWFAKADARLRYIRADAMIAARDEVEP